MTGTFLAAAVGVALAAIPQAVPRASFETLAEVDYAPATPHFEYHASLAFTGPNAYLATPGGLYRLPARVEGSPPEPAAFDRVSITRVYARGGRLYVLKPSQPTAGSATDHALLRSDDEARTFTPIDGPLGYCSGGVCQFMSGSELIIDGARLYYAAGGNVVASGDGGATWRALVGFLQPSFCYDPSIALVGDRMLIGGECPLDIAYVRAGRLAEDRLSWAEEPTAVATPYLENRNVQFIHRHGESAIVFAGIEGALLRSVDGGASFEFAYHVPIEGHAKYPYIGSIWMSDAKPGTVLAAGFDKKIS
ncbi:MAG TPA: hypothetical protein VGE86_00780, partial [Thermoanaerobaculia bacterium]